MTKPQRVYDIETIKAETPHIKSYKVLINALKQELNEKERTIEELQSLVRGEEDNTRHNASTILPLQTQGNSRRSIESMGEERIRVYKNHNLVQEENQKALNRTLPISEGVEEDLLKKKIELQAKIITEHEYTINFLKQQNEKLKKAYNESKDLKEELNEAKKYIATMFNELQFYKTQESEASNHKRNEEQLKDLLTQNEHLRQELKHLQSKLDNLGLSPPSHKVLPMITT